MNYIAGVEVGESMSDVRCLAIGVSVGPHNRRGTYKPESVCVGASLDVFLQVSARHPTRNELEGNEGNTQQG